MLLQYGMLLLGSYNPGPVSKARIRKGKRILQKYSSLLTEKGIPCRYTSHEIIHLAEDVDKYQSGVETLSAFPFENFQSFFRKVLRSGNLPIEQLRNRLIERSKYVLPTGSDGLFIHNSVQLELESQAASRGGIRFHSNERTLCKTLKYPGFTISTSFPNNFCFLKGNIVVVCKDIVGSPNEPHLCKIVGHRFDAIEDAFTRPFMSSEFDVYLAYNLNHSLSEWKAIAVSGKFYACPTQINHPPDIYDESLRWFISRLHHRN